MVCFQDHITQRSADLRKTFLKYDYDGDGKLSKKEFRLVSHLTSSCYWVISSLRQGDLIYLGGKVKLVLITAVIPYEYSKSDN